ncbi:dicarboxylate/amino acid:cation symporter [Catalinimonas niigatensis]|uniref:dicarboxylate/amino acid:cation symporter n=1 Tax=Catalinimonas niigatensis TaxID=1397264 RepID=UPI0026667CE3|nr:dicarboxylate/amino acid:cation symporter [Catalinimonas niigatensis]WPP51918.1 dicarboxylate/amino acid:cation symporter [Catalinimonas niigatensis]
MRSIPLHAKILLGLVLGLAWGIISVFSSFPVSFTTDFIQPLGTIFIALLKMVAMPLVLASLIVGVASMNDFKKLSRIGGRTIAIYICTTAIAISVGLVLVNIIQPGKHLPEDTRESLMNLYSDNVAAKVETATNLEKQTPLQPIIDMVPENLFEALTTNTQMLQVVFFALIFGIALVKMNNTKKEAVVNFFDGVNEAIITIVDFIMLLAPYGVFALISTLIVEVAGDDLNKALDLLISLMWYSATVVLGLLVILLVVYPAIFRSFTSIRYRKFFKSIRQAQLLGFTTSSSNATLPVTIKNCEENLGISREVSSFVLPLGATVNMDGTSLYQGVAAVFIAQALNMELTFTDQLLILLTATLASIGTAGVPGAGIVMLIIVLEAIHVPVAGISLILAVDRILDMCRTVVNVTGDVTVAAVIDSAERKRVLSGVERPKEKASA